jgi:hypothetical protein
MVPAAATHNMHPQAPDPWLASDGVWWQCNAVIKGVRKVP